MLLVLAISAPGLRGQPRDPCPAPEARQFDFWIGEWDVLNRQSPPGTDAWFEVGRATNRVYAAVGGCAVVEHWRGVTAQGDVVGFSVRSWNPETEVWDLVLLWPITGEPRFGELKGSFRDGEGAFFQRNAGPDGDAVLTRFTFSDIGPTSLRWRNGTSRDGGETWSSSWVMEFTRRPPASTGLLNGPAMTIGLCPDAVHRVFDDRLGEWRGRRADAQGRSVDVRVEIVRILEGCATLERAFAVDGSWEALTVRAYEPAAGRWVWYTIDTARLVLRRHETGEVTAAVRPDLHLVERAFRR